MQRRGNEDSVMKEGWGALLQGEPFDLEDWEHALGAGFDPYVERHGDDYVLRHSELDRLTSPEEVRDKAIAIIEVLNGVLRIDQGARNVSFSNALQILPTGEVKRHSLLIMSAFEMRLKSRATATVQNADGSSPPLPP